MSWLFTRCLSLRSLRRHLVNSQETMSISSWLFTIRSADLFFYCVIIHGGKVLSRDYSRRGENRESRFRPVFGPSASVSEPKTTAERRARASSPPSAALGSIGGRKTRENPRESQKRRKFPRKTPLRPGPGRQNAVRRLALWSNGKKKRHRLRFEGFLPRNGPKTAHFGPDGPPSPPAAARHRLRPPPVAVPDLSRAFRQTLTPPKKIRSPDRE